MSKYRIVARNTNSLGEISSRTWYYAQVKVFDLFWIDCRIEDLMSNWGDYEKSFYPDDKVVESYILYKRNPETKPKYKQEVIKTYD